MNNTARWEQQLKQALADSLGNQQAERLLQLMGNPPDPANVPSEFWAALNTNVAQAIVPIMADLHVEAAKALAASNGVGFAVDWTLANARAAEWAEDYTFELVRNITDHTRDRLRELVGGFVDSPDTDLVTLGESIGQLFGPVRGEMIAITEATRASAEGEEELVREIEESLPGARVRQIWLTSRDELVCAVCGPRHNQARGNGWDEPPPAHPRCRCALGTEIVLPEGAYAT